MKNLFKNTGIYFIRDMEKEGKRGGRIISHPG
jgi:hypothetical protein